MANDPEVKRTEAEVIIAEAKKPEILEIFGTPILVHTHDVNHYKMAELLPNPLRHSGSVKVSDVDSFIAYCKIHSHVGESLVFCTAEFTQGKVSYTAVYNDHTRDQAGWRDHRAVYAVQNSEEWKRWTGQNKKPMSQSEFATFLEDNMKDIAQVEGMPTGTDMFNLALSLEVNQDKRFKSAVRLQSGGVDLTFVDKEDDATLERMKVFDRFALGIAPFFNGQPYQIIARLKYRVKEGSMAFWYELIRPDRVVEDATKADVAKIIDLTAIPVLFGDPS